VFGWEDHRGWGLNLLVFGCGTSWGWNRPSWNIRRISKSPPSLDFEGTTSSPIDVILIRVARPSGLVLLLHGSASMLPPVFFSAPPINWSHLSSQGQVSLPRRHSPRPCLLLGTRSQLEGRRIVFLKLNHYD
jgi:hypothetical protein